MKNNGWRILLRLAWMTAALLIITVALTARQGREPEEPVPQDTFPPAASETKAEGKIGKSCQVIQTMAFSRCGHSVTRRVAAPEALWGADFAAARQYYDVWQIESYAPDQITLQREIALFCPMHAVLGVNDAGEAVLCRNVYGDGMAVSKSYGVTLDALDEGDREALLLGLGFDSEEEADAWLLERTKTRRANENGD